MPMLIAFRFFQGFGAGAIQPVSMTLVGDLYALEDDGQLDPLLQGASANA